MKRNMKQCKYAVNGVCNNPLITSKGHIVNDSRSSKYFCDNCTKQLWDGIMIIDRSINLVIPEVEMKAEQTTLI
jgi:hypothetical protein